MRYIVLVWIGVNIWATFFAHVPVNQKIVHFVFLLIGLCIYSFFENNIIFRIEKFFETKKFLKEREAFLNKKTNGGKE